MSFVDQLRKLLFAGELRPNELPEFPLRGPFGGIQSDIPLDATERLGFADSNNMILRKSTISVRPGYDTLAAFPSPAVQETNGIADFFTAGGIRIQTVMTPTRLLRWNFGPADWTAITGTLTGAVTDLFSWTVVNHKLLFCQGVDKVQLWDGVTAGFADADANAVPARYMTEIATHLVVADTIEAATRFHQRVRWTQSGDPTNWKIGSAGSNDLFNPLGPITGIISLFQQGYIFQQFGISQMIPTGVGTNPFLFRSISGSPKGCIAPFSLATYGERIAAYVGKDNIYVFNGTESVPIGDRPMEGSAVRIGARRRLMADLQSADLSLVYGYVSDSIKGNEFSAYWLFIPNVSVWIYNFDEGNWTRFTYDKTVRTIGRFSRAGVPRIIDLVGKISEQTWAPATLTGANPLDSLGIGFTDGTVGVTEFNSFSETAWSFKIGKLVFGDRRHNKTITKIRFILDDIGSVTFTAALSNEKGQSISKDITIGSGTGIPIIAIGEHKLNGMFFDLEISGAAGVPASFIEIAPVYDIGGEFVP